MSSLDRLSDFLVQLKKPEEQDAAAAPAPDAAPESALDALANFAAQLDLQSAPGAAPGSAPGEQDLTATVAKMYENEVVLPESVGFIPREIERGARGQVSQAAQAIATPGMRAQLIQSIYNGAWTLAELASAGMGPAMREIRSQSPELKQAITGAAAQETSMAIERAAFDTPMDPTRVREELIAAQGAAQGISKGQREGIVADVARATGQSLTQFAAMAPAVALGTPVVGAAMASQMYLPGSAWTAGALEYIDQTNRDRATAAMEGRDIPEFTLSGMRDYAATSAVINTGVELGGAALGGKIIGKIAKTTGATAIGQAALKPLIDRGMPIVDRVMVSKVGSKGLQTFARLSENTLEFRNGFFGKALAMGATSGLEESGEELVTAALMSPFTSAPLSEDIANGLYSAMIGLGAGGVGGVAPAGAFAVRQGVVNVRDSMRPETDRERVLRQIHTDAMQRKTNWSQDLSEEQNARLSTALDSVNGMDQEQRGTFLRELGDRRVDARTNADNLLTQRQQLDIGLTGALDLAENGTDEEKAAAKDQAEQIRGQIATIDEQLQLATSDAMMADAQYSAVAEKIGEMPATIDQAAPEQVLTDVSTRAGVELKPTAMPKNGARAQKQIEALGRKVVWFRPSQGTFSPAFHSMRSKGVVYMNADAAPANVLANALEEVFHDIQMFQPELAQVFMDKAGLMPVYQAGVAYAAQGTKESEDKARMDRAALAQAESAVAQLEGEQASISPEAARMGAARIEQEGTANAFAAAARATGSGSILAPLQQFAARRGLLGRDVMAAMAVLDAASRAAAVETVEGTKTVATLSPLARTLLWANDMNLDFKSELDAAESYARGELESQAAPQAQTDRGPSGATESMARASDAEYLAAVQRGDMAKLQPMVDKAARSAGLQRATRYTVGNKGLLNNQALNYDKLTDDEMAEVETLLPLGLEQPSNVPAGSMFYFTEQGLTKHARLIELLKKAARGKVVETTKYVPIRATWTSRDGQVAINPGQEVSADPVTRDEQGNVIPLSQRFDTNRAEISYARASDTAIKQVEQELIADEKAKATKSIKGIVEFARDRGYDMLSFNRLPDESIMERVKSGELKFVGAGPNMVQEPTYLIHNTDEDQMDPYGRRRTTGMNSGLSLTNLKQRIGSFGGRQIPFYVVASNPLFIDGKKSHWSRIPVEFLPKDFADFFHTETGRPLDGQATADEIGRQALKFGYDVIELNDIDDDGGLHNEIIVTGRDNLISPATGFTLEQMDVDLWRNQDGIPPYSSLTKIRDLGGSTGAALFEDPDGGRWVVKANATQDHLKNEWLAFQLYNDLGITDLPKNGLDAAPTKSRAKSWDKTLTNADYLRQLMLTKLVKGPTLGEYMADDEVSDDDKNQVREILAGQMMVDAVMRNWDVIGADADNIVVKDNRPFRVDLGGTLNFRAQGAKKDKLTIRGVQETLYRLSDYSQGMFALANPESLAKQLLSMLEEDGAVLEQNSTASAFRESRDLHIQVVFGVDRTRATSLVREYEIESRLVEFGAQRLDKILRGEVIPSDAYAREYWNIPFDNKSGSKQLEMAETIDDLRDIQFDIPSTANDLTDSNLKLAKLLRTALDSASRLELLKITEMEPDYGWKYVDIARKAITILDRIAGETDDGQKLKETVREALASYNEAIANKRNSIRDEVSKSDEIAALKKNPTFESNIEGFIDSLTMARVVNGEWMQSPEIVAAERVLSKAQKSLADFVRSSPTERARLAEVSYARPDEDAEVTALRQQIEDLKRQMRDVQNTTAAQRVNALREVRVLERKLSAAQLIAEQKIGQAARVSARLEIQKQVNRDAKQAAEETAAKMSTDLESARATVASLRQQLREAKSNADTEDLLREAEKKLDRVANWSYAIGRNEGLVAGQVAGMQQERREQLRVIKPLKERLPLVEARLAKATEDLRAARKQIAQDEKSAQKAVDFAYQLGMRSGQVQGMMRGRQVLLRKMAQREDTLQRQLTGLRDLMTTKVTNLEALRTAISQIATDAARTLPVRLRGPLAIRIANAKTIGQANRIAVEATKLAINEEVSSTLKTIARLKKQMNKRGMKYDTRVQIETLLRDADAALRQANRRRIQASVGVMKNAAGRSMGAAIINAVNVYSQVADAAAKVDAALVLYTNDAAAFKAEKEARVAKYQADTAALVANMQGRPTLPMRDRTDQPPRTSLARRIRVANSDIYTLQLELEGKSDGVINKLLTAAQQGKGASALEHAAIIRQLEPLLQAAGYSGLDDYALKNGMMGQTLVNPVTVTLGGSNVTIPVGTMLSIAAMDDETLAIFPKAGEPLTQGIRFPGSRTTTTIYPTREEIMAIKAGLTPGQQGLVDGMKAILETQIRDRTMDAIWKVEGDQPPIVQNYWPRIRDMAGFEGESAAVLNAAGALVRGALTSVGFANARTGGNRPLLYSDAFQTWDRHVQVALDMIHMAQPYRDAATVLSDQQVVSLMDKQMGPGTANAVLSIFSNGVGATARTNATIIDKLTNNVTGAVLSLSPRTWAKVQLGGVIRLASEVGPVYLAEGTARATAMLRSPTMWQARVEQIHSQSGYFTHRHQMNMRSIMSGSMSEQDRIKVMTAAKALYKSIAAATTTTRAANFTDTLNALGDTTDNANIVLSSLVDVLRGIDENIMLTAVEARLAEAKDEGYVGAAAFAVAVERAEQDFRRSQNSSDEFDETAFAAETRTSNKSPAWRLLFPFSSDTLKARNQIRRAWISGERRGGTALAIGGNLTTNAIINAASVSTLLYIAKTISSALGGADEPTDEEDKAFDKAAKELPVTVAAELSGQVGGYVGLALQGMITAAMYRRAPMQALITRPLEQTTREAAKIGGEDGSWAYLAPAILAAAQLRGVPAYQLYSFVAKQIPEAEKTPQEKLQKRLDSIEQRFSPEEIRKRVLQRAKNAGRVSIPLP